MANVHENIRDSQHRSQLSIDDDQEGIVKRNDLRKRGESSGLVILDLRENVPKGTHVFVDNYFSSIGLLREMTLRGYGSTPTLRSNRIGDCHIESEKVMMKQPRV